MSCADDKFKQRRFQQSRGRNSKINEPNWPFFEFVQDFIRVHSISKFQEVVIVMTIQTEAFSAIKDM